LIISALKKEGADVVVTLPEDPSANLTLRISKDPYFRYIRVTNEGHGIGITSGAALTGKKAVFVTGIAGLLAATYQLAHLGLLSRIPFVLLISYRGDIGDSSVPGTMLYLFYSVGEPLLRMLQIPYKVIGEPEKLKKSIHNAFVTATRNKTPVALLLTEDALW
jgi:phosphonopyruvate decarboxylase